MSENDRVAAAYDSFAERYADFTRDAMVSRPFDRALIGAFAEAAGGTGLPVVDAGCGPGHVTAYLAALGLSVFGVDISGDLLAIARGRFPELRFDNGSWDALDAGAGELGGVLAWYSLIHADPERVPVALMEFHRVLAPGGAFLTGFQAADPGQDVQAFDHKVTPGYRWAPARFADLITAAGFRVTAVVTCPETPDLRFPQGYVLAEKPPVAAIG